MKINIEPHETIIVGEWRMENGCPVADDSAKRVEALIDGPLVKIAESEDGWATLFLDPIDGRYWELTYPESNLHGGGAPCLKSIPIDVVATRFKIVRTSETPSDG